MDPPCLSVPDPPQNLTVTVFQGNSTGMKEGPPHPHPGLLGVRLLPAQGWARLCWSLPHSGPTPVTRAPHWMSLVVPAPPLPPWPLCQLSPPAPNSPGTCPLPLLLPKSRVTSPGQSPPLNAPHHPRPDSSSSAVYFLPIVLH